MTKTNIWNNKKEFIKAVYSVTLVLMIIYSFFERIVLIYQSAFDASMSFEGRIGSIILQFFLFTFLVVLNAGLGTIVYGTLLLIILFIPYLIYRKFFK